MRQRRIWGGSYTCIDRLTCDGHPVAKGGLALAQPWSRSCDSMDLKALERGLLQFIAIELLGP
jgi:hypothetical protein